MSDYVIIFYGIVLALLYYLLSVCTNNGKNNTELLSTLLSKLSESNPPQVQGLHEIEINGVKLKFGDADYIRLLEARSERTEKKVKNGRFQSSPNSCISHCLADFRPV